MNFYDFIAIMERWYGKKIIIHTDRNNDNNNNRRPITLSALGNPSNFNPITIVATDDTLTREDVSKVQQWLFQYSSTIDKTLRPEGITQLGQAITRFDDTKPGSLPEGYTVITEESGARTLFDKDGQNRGSLSADASLDDKTTLILTGLAEDISDEWVADPPENSDDIVLPDSAMEITTRMSESDIAAITADLNAQPGMGPLSHDSMDDLNADRLRGLSIDVGFTLAAKNAVSKTLLGIRATKIDEICKSNGFQFQYIDADGKRTKGWYLILDDKGYPIAGGQLNKPVWGLVSDYYLTDPKRLQDQIRDAKMLAAFAAEIPPEQAARTTRQEARIKDFLAERKTEPGKPGTGPDPKKKPDPKRGPGTGDPNDPGGPGV